MKQRKNANLRKFIFAMLLTASFLMSGYGMGHAQGSAPVKVSQELIERKIGEEYGVRGLYIILTSLEDHVIIEDVQADKGDMKLGVTRCDEANTDCGLSIFPIALPMGESYEILGGSDFCKEIEVTTNKGAWIFVAD